MARSDGLIQAGQAAKAEALMQNLAAAFPNRLYVELQRHPGEGGRLTEGERLTERPFIDMAYGMDLRWSPPTTSTSPCPTCIPPTTR